MRLPPDIIKRIDALAEPTGRSRGLYIRLALTSSEAICPTGWSVDPQEVIRQGPTGLASLADAEHFVLDRDVKGIHPVILEPAPAYLGGMGKNWIIAVLVGVPLMLVAGMIYWFLHPQLTLTLEDVMDAEYTGKDVTTDVVEITDTACNSDIKCAEAYSTAEANYYRFRTHAAATEYDAALDDGFSVNYFVMDFAGKDASVNDQLFAMQILAGMWNDYEGDFPAR
ncbi:hypothetical protein V6S67_08655 [Arthrobacter sp. Soc17.1.1.1]|uniref:hypothetical protein n=1 Tax=Arthrobacter sp. Soc17.1.1.1 TaxID=3121277 RepID=UPI002FE4DBBA